MKFAHDFQEALLREGFPPHWVDSAVPYRPLKKLIKKVQRELDGFLNDVGIQRTERGDGSVGFQYDFDGDKNFRPKLTLTFKGELPIDASLSPHTKEYLKAMIQSRRIEVARDSRQASTVSEKGSKSVKDPISIGDSMAQDPIQRDSTVLEDFSNSVSDSQIRHIEIPLKFDVQFFGLLQGDVTNLDVLQAVEQKAMTEQITALSKEITRLTTPSKFSKTDMYRWRALFDIYLQASIFFSTTELDRGSRNSTLAARQLDWFQTQVTRQGLVQAFKLQASRQALDRFVAINVKLLQNLKFQEINQKAVVKILKKFDKRTKLSATNTFPKFIQSDAIMSETMAKAVCAQVTDDLVKITPQLDDEDYTCPICSTIAWRPIRLSCHHVLCTKCTIELQRTFKYSCPICRRTKVVKEANEDNVDDELIKKLKKYFPKETREKRIELETMDGIARFGPTYKHPSEEKCLVM